MAATQLLGGAAHAQPLIESTSFTKIVDTSTAIPGGSGVFAGFGFEPTMSSGTIALYGRSTGFAQQGIFTSDGQTLEVLADLGDGIPGGTGNFTNLGVPKISGATAAFRGFGSSSQQGVYTANGALALIADLGDAIPGGTGNFTGFSTPSASGSRVVLWGQGDSLQRGIYLHDGSLSVVADTATAIPGGTGNFTSFSTTPTASDTRMAFNGSGSSGQRGIYTASFGGPVERVVDLSTAIPDGTGNFTGFQSAIGTFGTDVAFTAIGNSSQSGLYIDDGTLRKVGDRNTPIPDGSGDFLGFSFPALSNGNIVFEGHGGFGFGGIYADFGAGPEKIIDDDDLLDGKTIERMCVGSSSFDGTQVVFFVEFTNGSEGIFLADVTLTEPPMRVPAMSLAGHFVLAAALALAVLLVGARRPRVAL